MKYHTLFTEAELRALGVPAPWTIGTADRVRFGELDALNHVNHTAYLRWFETFRITYLREYAISTYDADSPRIVLKSIQAEYIREMTINQDYIITGRTSSFRNTSWVMEYGVWTDLGLQATGQAVIVQLDPATGNKRPLSAAVRKAFVDRDGASAA